MSQIPVNYAIDKRTGNPFFPVTHINAVRDDEGNPLSDLLAGKSVGYGTCDTAADTAAKTVTVGDGFVFGEKKLLVVKFTNGISVAGATLAVTYTDKDNVSRTTAALPIYYRKAALGAGRVAAGDSLTLRYNGTQLEVVSALEPVVVQVSGKSYGELIL